MTVFKVVMKTFDNDDDDHKQGRTNAGKCGVAAGSPFFT